MKMSSWLRLRAVATSLVLSVVAIAISGCADNSAVPGGTAGSKGTAGSTTNGAATIPGWPPTKAQPKLRTLKLYVGPEVINAELALSQIEVGTGMMFRTSMAEDEGMLFVFAYPHRTSFYMKNTTVPLTAAYIDPQGTILELVELNPLVETPVEAKFDNVQYVLEMKRGWFERHNIKVGTVISTERGSLSKTFGTGN